MQININYIILSIIITLYIGHGTKLVNMHTRIRHVNHPLQKKLLYIELSIGLFTPECGPVNHPLLLLSGHCLHSVHILFAYTLPQCMWEGLPTATAATTITTIRVMPTLALQPATAHFPPTSLAQFTQEAFEKSVQQLSLLENSYRLALCMYVSVCVCMCVRVDWEPALHVWVLSGAQ